jgi:hypothetical protein
MKAFNWIFKQGNHGGKVKENGKPNDSGLS